MLKPDLFLCVVLCCLVLCCVVLCCVRCVVGCVGGVCSRFSSVRPRFGRSPLSRTLPPPDLLSSADRPKFHAVFFTFPPQFSFFLLSLWGPSVEFWWCLKRPGPEMCTFGVLGLSCEAPAAPKPFGASQFGAPPFADTLA